MKTANCPRLVISATHKSSGKTVTSVGLCAVLNDLGLKVQPFKKGPDYIDPGWLSTAAGRECRNLDNFMMGWEKIEQSFKRHCSTADISIIEGNKGLYDAVETDGEGSTASLARRLGVPVILVVDAGRITRGVAPLLLGYKMFEPDTNIAGVILNKVSSARHEAKLRAVIEKYLDIEILGVIRKSPEMEVLERHLGLVPVKEELGLYPSIEHIRKVVAESVNIDRIIAIANSAQPIDVSGVEPISFPTPVAKIGVIRDQAFTFYYPENLEALRSAGAQLVPVNALNDTYLPKDLDALYIGGGFPESFMEKLERNETLRTDIHLAIENGMPVHAECGGLIYLARSVSWGERTARMVGALDCDVLIKKKPKGHGYIKVEGTGNSPWLPGGCQIPAHEFHYGDLVNLKHTTFALRVIRGHGVDGSHDGIVYKNVTAGFTHLHALGCEEWAKEFVNFAHKAGFAAKGRAFFPVVKDRM